METPETSLSSIKVDRDFQSLLDFLHPYREEKIQSAVERNLEYLKNKNEPKYQATISYYNKYKFWGIYAPRYGIHELSKNRAHALSKHLGDFEWLYQKLGDYRSKTILTHILYYWLMSDDSYIAQIQDLTFHQYFDLDLIHCDRNEVFVDAGAYVGDTLASYLQTFDKNCYKKIYCYEILSANLHALDSVVEQYHLRNISVRLKGLSDKAGTLYLNRPSAQVSSTSRLTESGEEKVEAVTIDSDIHEPVTFVKMDLEGMEEQALHGCRQQITEHHPKLALSAYHNHRDLWNLARIITSYDPTYHFYLRYYGKELLPTEYILYAV